MELDELIAPVSVGEFFECYWEKDVLHISRGDPEYFPFLDGVDSLEQAIQLFCREWGDVSLARAGTKASECPYINRPPDLRTISRAFQEKYTVVVNDLQAKDLSVARLCRSIERSFFCRANVNAYLTNVESQGLDAHYDDDDVFVLQLSGAKSWNIYRKRADLPLPDMPYANPIDRHATYVRYDLCPGDLLYIPRGVVHEAVTATTVSLHLTLSLNTVSWVEVIQAIIQLYAQQDIQLRRSVPPNLLQHADCEAEGFSIPILRDDPFRGDVLKRAIHKIQDRVLGGMGRIAIVPLCRPPETAALTEDTLLHISPDQVCCVEWTEESCKLKAIGAEFEFPGALGDLARFVCNARQFTPGDLPGGLSRRARLEISQQFLDNGLIVRAAPSHNL